MKKTLRYEEAFALLSNAAIKHGVDKIVKDPADLIRQSLNISQSLALSYLKELERRNLIALNYDGVRIGSARILKEELPERLHETDNMTRVLMALWKYRRSSQSDPKKQIVHPSFLGNVQGDADVLQPALYLYLQKFSEKGWVEMRYSEMSRSSRLLYVEIKKEFPIYLVQ